MIEMLLSGGGGGGVPAGTIIGFSGTLAQANALKDWAICDGTNNTPNLNGRMIIGASGDYPFGSKGQGGRVGGISGSSAGAHHGTAQDQEYILRVTGSGVIQATSGSHTHTLLTSTIPNPAARQTLFIQAIRETLIPQYGVVWMESAPSQGVDVVNGIFGRFLVGVINESRGNTGSDSITLSLSTSSSGDHRHEEASNKSETRSSNVTGKGYSSHGSAGRHTHTVPAQSITAVPPWYGLTPGEAKEDIAPWKGLVLAYNGDLAALPPPWREFTQLRGRIPRGANIPGNTGGTARQVVTATIGSESFGHTHVITIGWPENYSHQGSWVHKYFVLWHTHDSMSLTYSNLPPYKALHYITI